MFNKNFKLFLVTLIFMLSISSVAAVEIGSTDDVNIGDADEEPPSGTIQVDSIDEVQTSYNEVLRASNVNASQSTILSASNSTNTLSSNGGATNEESNQVLASKNTVKDTVDASDFGKRYRSSSNFYATFYDFNGDPLADTDITFVFNNHLNFTARTDSNGVAMLAITATVGTHTITSVNPVTGQTKTNKVTVYNSVRANNLEKRYRSSDDFTATFYGLDERPYANKEVTFLFNNHLTLKAMTDSNGVARIPITATVGTHTIVSINPVTGQRITNKITVLPTVLVTKSWTTFSDRNTKLVVTLYKDGRLAKNADVNVYVNGVKNQIKTDSNGVAYYTFKLDKGTYEFKSQDPNTGYTAVTTIKVLDPTVKASNMEALINTDSTYTATLLNEDGSVRANANVEFTLNGKTYSVKTNSKGEASLKFNLAKGNYKVTCKDLDTGYAVTKTITVSSTVTENVYTSSAPVTYNQYGVSSDGKTILAIGRASASGEYSKYGYTFYVTEFERTCSCCGGHNLYWSIFWAGNEYTNYGTFPATGLKEGSSAEGAIFCADCDSDWSVFGHNHGGSGGDLTVVTKTTSSSKADAYALKSGNYAKS